MKMNEMKLVYFSPTGTTRRVMMEAARKIELKSLSFDLTIHKEKKPSMTFQSDDFALFAVPVYAGRVPAVYLDYFEQLKGQDTPAAIVVTYGCRAYDDALLELKNEVESRGFHVIGAAAFPTEHSIIRSIGLSRPNKSDVKLIADFGVQLNRRLKQSDPWEEFQITVPGNSPYKDGTIKGLLVPKTDKTRCTECGACVKACPAGAISSKDPKKIDRSKCISCQKCVRNCKEKARHVSDIKRKLIERKLTKLCRSDIAAEIFL